MEVDIFGLVAFLHVVLFAYWLGGDLGVFFCAKRLTRDDLSLDERLRVREIGIAIDMAPRTALVLMVPVGFTLSVNYGAPLHSVQIGIMWIISLGWLWLVWKVHHKKGTEIGRALQNIDFAIRYALMIFMAALGIWSLIYGVPIADQWLAIKIALFAAIILNGIWLRKIGGRWQAAFDLVRAEGESRIKGEQMIKENRKTAAHAAILIWSLVLVMAFLGVVKPYL